MELILKYMMSEKLVKYIKYHLAGKSFFLEVDKVYTKDKRKKSQKKY